MSSDPTEAIRRVLVPEVNQQGADALAAANALMVAEHGADTEVTEEEADALLKQRDKDAAELLRATLVAEHGEDNVFDTVQLSAHFDVTGFGAPLVVVTRKADGKKGSLFFIHHPRFYYGFQPH
jgi:hypothetical protein